MDEAGLDTGNCERLDLDAPILSIRRAIGSHGAGLKCRTHREMGASIGTVPFLWERAPGMAKNAHVGSCHEVCVPPPKPPPNRWHPSLDYSEDDDDDDDDEYRETTFANNDDNDIYTDAMDIISLSESFDLACSTSRGTGSSTLTSEALKSKGSLSPTFIIRKFLPAATALASSSSSSTTTTSPFSRTPKKNLGERTPRRRHRHRPNQGVAQSLSSHQSTNTPSTVDGGLRMTMRSYSPARACGLELFSPWHLKQALCGLKSPIIRNSPPIGKLKRPSKHTENALAYGPRRKREKLNDFIGGRAMAKGVGNEGESRLEKIDARSAPEQRRNVWSFHHLNSPTESSFSHGLCRRY